MSGIPIVVFLVHCNQSLLLCNDIDTRHLAFADIAVCRAALTRIVEDYQRRLGDRPVVMGKCQYRLLEPAPDRAIAKRPKGRRQPRQDMAVGLRSSRHGPAPTLHDPMKLIGGSAERQKAARQRHAPD